MELDTNQFRPLPQDGLGYFYRIVYEHPVTGKSSCTCWGNTKEEALQTFKDTHNQGHEVLTITLDFN